LLSVSKLEVGMQTATGVGGLSQERRFLTVMFCDVVGSTGLSGRQDIEGYYSILRAYYDACQPVVERHHGRIAQHQGDGIFVWFGYPEAHDDDAVRAVRAGLDLLVVLRKLSWELQSAGGEQLSVRIAAHAGEVLIAAVRGEKTPIAFGHTPNVAAKLQQSARPGSFIISDALRRLTADVFELKQLEESRLADGSVVDVFEVIGERPRGRVRRRWRTRFVDRQIELQQLSDAWTRTSSGSSEVVVLRGERGIGKTRLASALASAAAAQGAAVLDWSCHPLDSSSAYEPCRTFVRQSAGVEPGDPPVVAAARLRSHLVEHLEMDATAVAVLGGLLGLPDEFLGPSIHLDPIRRAQVTSELLVGWLTRLASRSPTLLLVDDIPDADPSTLAVLAQLVAAPTPGLLLLATATSSSSIPEFLVGGSVATVELRALPKPAAVQLVASIESWSSLDDARRAKLIELGGGVPLYLEELAWAAHESALAGTVPATLAEVLQVRLSAPGVDRDVIAALAAAGQDLDAPTLGAVLDMSADELEHRLLPLLDADLVMRAGSTATSVQIRHGLIAESAYAMLLQSQRAHLHQRIADALTAQGHDGRTINWILIGQHLIRAGRPLDAFEAILAGAEQARRAGATTEALSAYATALEIVAGISDRDAHDVLEVRCRLERGIAAVTASGFGADEAVEDFSRCAELCVAMGPRPEHLTALTGVYAFFLLQGRLARAREIAEDLRIWVDTAHHDYRPDNDLAFGVLSFYEGNYGDAIEQLTQATRQSGRPETTRTAEQDWLLPIDSLTMAYSHLAAALWLTGRPRAGHEAADRAIARAATLSFPEGPFSMAYAKSFVAWMYALGGHHEGAARHARELRAIGDRHGFAFWETAGEIHLALSEYWLGEGPDAWATVSLHAQIWEMLRARVFLPYVLTAAAAVRGDMGDRVEAVAEFEAAGTLAEATGARFFEAERLRLQARVLPDDRQVEADELRYHAWRLAHEQGAIVFELRAALDLARSPGSHFADPLAAVVAGFPAGAGYPELNEAHALLRATSLPSS
jgi:class 3 adenylate cyclase